MKTELTNITPQTAAAILEKNTNNRRLSQPTVNAYAREMQNGRWQVTHQGVAVYDDGTLADGQHRLAAIVESGCTVPMLLTTGIPKASASGIDVNRPRSAIDVIRITGSADWINTKMLQSLRLVYATPKKVTPSELEVLGEHIKGDVEFTDSLFKRNMRGTGAALRATITLAHYYGASESRLAEFVSMYYSGIVSSKADTAVIKLRDYMMSKDSRNSGSSGQKSDLNLCQNAVRKFLDYQPVGVLRETKELHFPQLDPKPVLDNN